MEGAVINYAGGVVQPLLGKLGQLLGEEVRLLSGVRGEVAHFRDELATMNALLRTLTEAGDNVDHLTREWMKQVRELAYDAEDCIDIFELRLSCAPPRVLGRYRHLLSTLRLRKRLAADIQALRARALAVSERRGRYGVDRPELLAAVPSGSVGSSIHLVVATMREARAVDTSQYVGIDDQTTMLADMMRPKAHDGKLRVVSIVGFGGLGKTTLAMAVCRSVAQEFDFQASVSVSQAWDLRDVLRSILEQTMKGKEEDTQEEMDVSALRTELSARLEGKRYLIVIDDVWTIAAWEAIRCNLPDNHSNSRIIVTTRIDTVAKACSTSDIGHVHRIKPLSEEDSYSLFVSRIFGSNGTCPRDLEVVSTKILRKCGGLPLAIISIAGLLMSKPVISVEVWERVCNSIGSELESNPTLEGMKQILTLSYNDLPHHLKTCFMYLSIFPEDYVIRKERLLHRWIAEGFILEKRGLTLLEVAEGYFEELVSRSMIDPVKFEYYDIKVKTCRVHDMMLEVLVSKSLEANFVTLIGDQYRGTSYDTVRRLSIHDDSATSSVEGMTLSHVRSLSTFRSKNYQVRNIAKLSLLRVLDLEGCRGVESDHIKHICNLFQLKFLSLRRTDLRDVPSQISRLQHLQTLDVKHTYVYRLPESVINLEKLEHLTFHLPWTLPRGVSNMKALRTISGPVAIGDDDCPVEEIGELTQIQKLSIEFNTFGPPVLDTLAVSLSKMYGLRALSLRIHHTKAVDKSLNFLERLPSHPPLLQKLRLFGPIDKLPSWIELLTNLVCIELNRTDLHGDSVFGVLHKLPNLLIINLENRSYVDDELVARTAFAFQALKVLFLDDVVAPPSIQFEKGAMPKLERLDVCCVKGLIGIEHLTSLKEVKISGENPELKEQLRDASERHPNQFKVVPRY